MKKESEKRYNLYKFLIDHRLYGDFVVWFKTHPHKSRYRAMYLFIYSRGWLEYLQSPLYDRKCSPSFADTPSDVLKVSWL